MKLEFNRIEALELQGIMRDSLSEQKYLHALETFNSSKLESVYQLNHTLMKLEQSIKNNRYNPNLRATLEQTVEELTIVKDEFTIDDSITSLVIACCLKDIEKFNILINHNQDQFSETYISNITARRDALISVVNKINQTVSKNPTNTENKRTLEDYCKSFYHAGFIEFWYFTKDSGTVRYKDGDNNIYRDTMHIINGRPVTISSVKE